MIEKITKYIIYNEDHGYAQDNGAKTFSKERKTAYEWKTMEAAKNVLNNGAKFSINDKSVVIESSIYTSDVPQGIKSQINTVMSFIDLIDSYKDKRKELLKRQTDLELKQNDLLHYIQLVDVSSVKGFKLYKKLQEIRQERSYVKQMIHLIDAVLQYSIDTKQLRDTLTSMQKELSYRPRILDFDDILREE